MSAAIITFLILTAIFQIMAIYTYRHEIRWLYVDYIWLVIASAALIFYALKADQDEAKRVLPAYDNHLTGMAEIARGEIGFSDFFLTFFSMVKVTNETSEISQQKVEFERLNKKLDTYRLQMKSLDWPYNIEKFHSCKNLGADFKTVEAGRRVKAICETFDSVIKSRTEREDIAKRARGSEYSAIEIYIFPFFLALALSLRLARTTADLLRKKAC